MFRGSLVWFGVWVCLFVCFGNLVVPLCCTVPLTGLLCTCSDNSTDYSEPGKADIICVCTHIVNLIHSDSIRFTACIFRYFF